MSKTSSKKPAAKTTTDGIENHGVYIPEVNDNYYILPEVESLFRRIELLSRRSGHSQKCLLTGPHGAGKTEMAMEFAARMKRPLLIMDCSNLREPRDWFGYRQINRGKIVWHVSSFDKSVSAGGHVILLDEMNRVHPAVMNTLMPLLDGRGFTYLEEKGEVVRVGKETVFFASMNEGAGYTGTLATDLAVRDRFPRVVEVKYLVKTKEIELLMARTGINQEDATKLVDIAHAIRSKSVGVGSTFSGGFSTRQLIAVAEDFTVDGPDSLDFTLTNLFSSEGGTNSERAAALQLVQGKFGHSKAKAASRLGGK
jgi:MoxR-like ATPase